MNVSDDRFRQAWNDSETIDDLASAMGRSVSSVRSRASALRMKGFVLKTLRTRLALTRAQRMPRRDFDHSRFTQADLDELIDGFSSPYAPATLDEGLDRIATEELYRRAAEVRSRRPGRGAVEDRQLPVETTIIRTADVGLS